MRARIAKRIDGNQKQLVAQIRKIPGVTVAVTSSLGEGYPDLTVSFRGNNYLFEVKDPSQPPSKRRLTPEEQKFHEGWTGQICIVETIEDVLKELKLSK